MATVEEQLSEEQRRALAATKAQSTQGRAAPTTHAGPGSSIAMPDPEVAEVTEALKALAQARAAQDPVLSRMKAEDEATGGEVDREVLDLSIQKRAAPADVPESTSAVWWFVSTTAGDIAPWWSSQRDQDLREFWMKEGNDILQGAVTSMVKKFRAMNWQLEGPEQKVQEMQDVLSQAEFGQGWGAFIGKTITDYLTQDAGAFWELIGEGDPDGPMEGLPKGVAHLDAGQCQLTGDPVYPVLYRNPKELYCPKCGKKFAAAGNTRQCPDDQTQLQHLMHRLHATRVVHLVDMPSPNESMHNVGFCGVSRVIASSYVLLKLAQYKNEKLSDLPQAGLLLLNNILPAQWENITKATRRTAGGWARRSGPISWCSWGWIPNAR